MLVFFRLEMLALRTSPVIEVELLIEKRFDILVAGGVSSK